MIFVVSSSPTYPRAWVFPSLRHLSGHRVIALLDPSDRRELPLGVERRDFVSDCFFYDGRFVEALDVEDVENIVLIDADAVVQRAPRDGELECRDGFAIGYNAGLEDTAALESKRIAPFNSFEGMGRVVGVDLRTVPMRNMGITVAKAWRWRWLREAYAPLERDGYALLQDRLHFMQFFACIAIAKHGVPLRDLGYETHSHGHYGLTADHSIRDGQLLYRGQPVFFAHFVKGVTH